MMNAKLMAELMRRQARLLGLPTGTLQVEYPQTVTAAPSLHPFMRQKSVATVVFTFPGLDGAWQKQSDDDTTGAGIVDYRTGKANFYHKEARMSHNDLRALFANEGAVATWEGVRVEILQVLPDELMDATVIVFRRQDVTS